MDDETIIVSVENEERWDAPDTVYKITICDGTTVTIMDSRGRMLCRGRFDGATLTLSTKAASKLGPGAMDAIEARLSGWMQDVKEREEA